MIDILRFSCVKSNRDTCVLLESAIPVVIVSADKNVALSITHDSARCSIVLLTCVMLPSFFSARSIS